MLNILENYQLTSLNTFGIAVSAKKYIQIKDEKEIPYINQTLNIESEKFLILGGGSNLLFTGDFTGTIIHPVLRGIEIINQENNQILLEVKSGEVWDDFVQFCVNNNYGGAENLSLIPGNVGASAIQNIGAYGKEAKDIIHKVHGYYLISGEKKSFTKEECQFDYRWSIFKTFKEPFIITSVEFILKTKEHDLDYSYGAIQGVLEQKDRIDIKSIREAIIAIREQKLPDPKELGNAGSFFKNPIINKEKYTTLSDKFENVPSYQLTEESFKIPAAWLIDQCGWKGKKIGNVGVHKNQALVIVNYGGAHGQDIIELSNQIKQSVHLKFDIQLEEEVIII